MSLRPPRLLRAVLVTAVLSGCTGGDGGARVVIAATHTLEDAGLLAVLDSAFRAAHPELDARIVVTGSGEALEIGRRRDADVLLTHAPEDEQRFVAEGFGAERRPVMHNDFLVVGPPDDPAGVAGTGDAAAAFAAIERAGAPFVSRGDDSGTHKRERALWAAAGSTPDWEGYAEAGVGMADALRVAAERGAYILTDRATWATLAERLELTPVVQGDPRLLNVYAVTLVVGANNPAGGRAFADWLLAPETQALIQGFGTDAAGIPLFLPEALPAGAPLPAAVPPPTTDGGGG